ncbi:hypothetical protein AFK68_01675 [Hydrocoleum sp. CS-953]|nr:hypothetical protein AFK68_01675 [Hydrocoleum sp. CS-953]
MLWLGDGNLRRKLGNRIRFLFDLGDGNSRKKSDKRIKFLFWLRENFGKNLTGESNFCFG